MDTIFALASAQGKAGVAIVRVSGVLAHQALETLSGPPPLPRLATLRTLSVSDLGVIDDALVLRFEEGHSFTGEDVAEFHVHGSTAIIAALLKALGQMPGLRLAEPGEFTRRALENGCLDLTQVEGLGDLIEAETEAQRKQAMRVFDGALGAKAETWRRDLIRAVSLIEATIDFVDEDVPVDVSPEVLELLDRTQESLTTESKGSHIAERIREGFEVAIVGPPNIGKSTLLNRLAGRDAAITSEIAGTTRDVIEVRMDLGGLPVTILDTAGLRETTDHVEGLGVERAKMRARHADLRVFLVASGDSSDLGIKPEPDDIVVFGKSDLFHDNNVISVSGLTGDGVSGLISEIQSRLNKRASGAATATHIRHRLAIDAAISLLDSARDSVLSGRDKAEFASADLHRAIRSLDSLIGRVDVEHVLDEIFASFCLGK
ncbi:MAG: tRNA uridine-5-carboxymethylaminomethyl(34) synthesis GTPase MnmE [Rhodobacter sp.]|jgi:tRNA modification GTPase|nr:tRNA uridine-5-carboxymethylaminomethyl(34) synthesis GTPase MnmE [Rhodobacter sp.]